MTRLRAVETTRHNSETIAARPRIASSRWIVERTHVYYLLLSYLVVVFLTGGGARSDIQSLVLLRPLSVLVCGAALLTLRWEDLRQYRFLTGMFCCLFLLALLHLVPLPPSLWQGLPGRDLVLEVERAAGLSDVWRPLSLTPTAAQNAFFALFVPLGVFLLTIQLSADDQRRLATPLLGIGAVSGIIGIVQIAGDPNGALYLYRITNNGQSVGLFSNRNHHAVYLAALFPLLAYYASRRQQTEEQIKLRLVICASAAAILVPLVLVTGSRQGLLLGILALVVSTAIFERPEAVLARRRGEQKSFSPMFVAIFAALMLTVVTVIASRADALKRLVETDLSEEGRGEAWQVVARLIADYFPVGSGSGSFVEVYQIAEPLQALNPAYLNHAHNDFLEVALTFGLPGIALLAIAVLGYLLAVWKFVRARKALAGRDRRLALTGLVVALLIGLASVVDYPLRTPSVACFFVIACCWITQGIRKPADFAGAEVAD